MYQVLVADWPLCNILLVCLFYVSGAYQLYRITLNTRAMILPNSLDDCQSNLAKFLGTFAAAAAACFVIFGPDALGIRHGYVLAILVCAVGAAFCVLAPIRGRKIPIANVAVVAMYLVALACALTINYGELPPLVPPDTAAIEARKAAMRKKPAFVGNEMVLGLVAVGAGAVMIYTVRA